MSGSLGTSDFDWRNTIRSSGSRVRHFLTYRARGERDQEHPRGSAGVMLPSHAPLIAAEQFGPGILESLFPSASIWDWVEHQGLT
jgi:hypothetical protein